MSQAEAVDPGLGLTGAEAARRLAAEGPNALPEAERRTLGRVVLEVVREPMLALLLASTAIYLVFGDIREAITLGVFVFVVIGITIVQERRTEHALDALRELSTPRARVLRDASWTVVDARELVPGDVIRLGDGDRVPADATLRTGTPMTVDESLLTGESVPVIALPGEGALHAGTLIGAGHGIAEVTATGARSQLGRIGASLRGVGPAKTPLQREMARLVAWCAAIAIALSAALVVIRGLGGAGWLHAALAGITLAMSLLPEEVPVILAVFLAIGAWRIARDRVLARRPSAIETLGQVTVLCVDKTGTLTQNRMHVRRLSAPGAELDVFDEGAVLPEDAHALVEIAHLACPREPIDPMDRAIARIATGALDGTEHLHPSWVQVREYPLRPGLLAVTHVWRDDETRTAVATKGAPEAVLDLCHLSGDELARWRARAEAMAAGGLRVLGVARARGGARTPPEAHDYDFEMCGLVGLADPIRPDTADTVARCRKAGVRVVMITGDHPATARAIARAAGIAADEVVTGAELEELDDDALGARLEAVDVVARAAPAHKLRIVRALQRRGEVAGMTGDGVNDAPALAAADIGIAMGARGTDVAREAAALVLVDDDLGSIVGAVRTGRRIYDNIRKAVQYTIAVHVPIAGLALFPPLLGWGALLTPIHVVFLELLIDPTCSVVFESEPEEADVMDRPPRRPGAPLLGVGRLGLSLLQGALVLAAGLAMIGAGHARGLGTDAVRALAFVALIAGNVSIVIANRSADAPWWRPRARNPALRWLLGGAALLLAVSLGIAPVSGLFQFAPPAAGYLALTALAATAPLLAISGLARAGARA
jgi:Ca2+-transporting ATPase